MLKASYINCPSCMTYFKFFKDDSNNENINLKCPNCNQRFSISSKPTDLSDTATRSYFESILKDENVPHTAPVESKPVVDEIVETSSNFESNESKSIES